MAVYSSVFSDLKSSVVDALRLESTLDATRVAEWLNQALLDIAVKTSYFSGSSAGTALTAAATSQALPSAVVELEYVTCAFGGQTTYMRPASFEYLLMLRAASAGGSGPPFYYSLRKNTVEFWPTAAGGEILTYYGATLPDEMTAAGDVTGLPEPFASTLPVLGACIDAADFKNDPKLYLYYQGAYEKGLGSFQAYLNKRTTKAPREFPVVGPDGRPFGSPFLPHDPSSDFYVTGLRGV